MSRLRWAQLPPRTELVRSVRARIGELGGALRVLAENLLGADAPIDLLAVDPDGRAVIVLVTRGGDELETLAVGLAQRAWLAPRIKDWLQLAPQLGLRPELVPRLLLVAPVCDARTLAALRAIDPEGIDLVLYRPVANGAEVEVLLDPVHVGGAPGLPGQGATAPASRFRTGLSDEDLGLTPAERTEFD